MASLNHQACGILDLASAARCRDRVVLSKYSNQNEKPDLGQESDAHDRDRKEHVARRERGHECLASCEAPGVNHSGCKMFRFQMRSRGHVDAAFVLDLCCTSDRPSDADGPCRAVVERRAKTLSQLSRLTVPSLLGTKRHPS